jgi:putative endonuclease
MSNYLDKPAFKKQMATVYILYSKKLDRCYTGSCLDFGNRYQKHKERKDIQAYTAKAEDWTLYLRIDDLTYEQARGIEAHIKRMRSRLYIENLIKYPEMVAKLIIKYS